VRPHRDAQAGPGGGAGPTSDLLKAASSNVLRFKIDANCRHFWRPRRACYGPNRAVAGAHDALEIEQYLAAMREAGLHAEDIEIRKADLEDVFLDVMAAGHRKCCAGHGQGAMTGWQTLFYKEVLRFWKVSFQTVAAPVLTAMLYMLIFGHVLEDHVKVYDRSYTAFLVPGLVMMSVLQNAFANSSSSLIQSKIMGNLVFLLLTPLSHWSWFFAYVGSSVVRGLVVGTGVLLVTAFFASASFCGAAGGSWCSPVLGAAMLGALGLIAGLWAEKFDQMAAFQNFIIMPMTFLSRRVLLDPFAAAFLAGREPPEPVLLHDRRVPLRLFRCQRRIALAEPGHRRDRTGPRERHGHAPAAHRLQDPGLNRLT
jgi:ABC-2 type transport system permease protein